VLESNAKENEMKKLYVAALGLALLTTGTVVFAQNTATGSTDTMSSGKKHKKSKKNKGTMSDTAGTASSTK
jgi:hypothetical protein